MPFRNPCCRQHFSTLTNQRSGDTTTCPVCGNEHVWDGLHWQNPHELGTSKMRKLNRIRLVNQYVEPQLEP